MLRVRNCIPPPHHKELHLQVSAPPNLQQHQSSLLMQMNYELCLFVRNQNVQNKRQRNDERFKHQDTLIDRDFITSVKVEQSD